MITIQFLSLMISCMDKAIRLGLTSLLVHIVVEKYPFVTKIIQRNNLVTKSVCHWNCQWQKTLYLNKFRDKTVTKYYPNTKGTKFRYKLSPNISDKMVMDSHQKLVAYIIGKGGVAWARGVAGSLAGCSGVGKATVRSWADG